MVRICNSEANTCIPLEPVRFDLERTAKKLRAWAIRWRTRV